MLPGDRGIEIGFITINNKPTKPLLVLLTTVTTPQVISLTRLQ